jgi:hypothetical protein
MYMRTILNIVILSYGFSWVTARPLNWSNRGQYLMTRRKLLRSLRGDPLGSAYAKEIYRARKSERNVAAGDPASRIAWSDCCAVRGHQLTFQI